jgi:two-component system chemotaxis response regulator CheB
MTRGSETHPTRNVILIGGSQGSISAVRTLLGGLPARFRAAVGVTLHRSAMFASSLVDVFDKQSPLPVVEPGNGRLFEPGMVYLAPRDHHLVFRAGAVWLDRGPKHHFARPAVDVMFTSGAEQYGSRVIGVLLTGNLSDGVAGLVAIKQRGGLSLAQDPAEAEAPSMPQNAVKYDDVDAIFPIASLSALLSKLVSGIGIDEAAASNGVKRLAPKPAASEQLERRLIRR